MTTPGAKLWHKPDPVLLCAPCRTQLERRDNHTIHLDATNCHKCGSFDIRGEEWTTHLNNKWCAPCATKHLTKRILTKTITRDLTQLKCMVCQKDTMTKYWRGPILCCSGCSKHTAKPDELTMHICRHAITLAGFTPKTHDEADTRDKLIKKTLHHLFQQGHLPTGQLLTHISFFLRHTISIPAELRRDIEAMGMRITFSATNPPTDKLNIKPPTTESWNNWLPEPNSIVIYTDLPTDNTQPAPTPAPSQPASSRTPHIQHHTPTTQSSHTTAQSHTQYSTPVMDGHTSMPQTPPHSPQYTTYNPSPAYDTQQPNNTAQTTISTQQSPAPSHHTLTTHNTQELTQFAPHYPQPPTQYHYPQWRPIIIPMHMLYPLYLSPPDDHSNPASSCPD